MLKNISYKAVAAMLIIGLPPFVIAQDGNRVEPTKDQSVKSVMADIQAHVNNIQTLQATLEYDQHDKDANKKKKKKKDYAPNPKWPEPWDRDIERGPMQITRGVGAYLLLQRKTKKKEYFANSSTIWTYDYHDKEARRIPASWPVINTFVASAFRMNVFPAMEPDSIKLRGTESVDGTPCWVLQGKSPSKLKLVGVDQTKLKMWIGQADGIPRVIKIPDEDDAIIRLKNIQLNQPVDDSKYSFTPPAGVKVKNILGF